MTNPVEMQSELSDSLLYDLKKQSTNEPWTPHMEELMKSWGEKAAGLRYMHSGAAKYWRRLANKMTMCGILITSVASILSLVSGTIDDPVTKDIIMYSAAGVGTLSGLVQSVKKIYNAEEKAADHRAIAKQFGSLYRYMTLQMGMSRKERTTAHELTQWALKEYERLQQDAPILPTKQIELYKVAFKDSHQATPDVCEEEFIINVYPGSKPPPPSPSVSPFIKGMSRNSDASVIDSPKTTSTESEHRRSN